MKRAIPLAGIMILMSFVFLLGSQSFAAEENPQPETILAAAPQRTPTLTSTPAPSSTPVMLTIPDDYQPIMCAPGGMPPSPTPLPSPTGQSDTSGMGGGGMGGGGGGGGGDGEGIPFSQPAYQSMDEEPIDMFFEEYGVNPFLDTEDDHLSTFAVDVDTASYTLARSYLTEVGQLPPPEAIRPEEMVNYFSGDYAPPTEDEEAFAIHLDAAPAPFGFEGHYLMRVGLQGRSLAPDERDPALLVFVVDVSGSMEQGARLELVKETLYTLLDNLRPDDQIGIVVFTDTACVQLTPTPASEQNLIRSKIAELHPQNSTNTGDGLVQGYDMAEAFRQEGRFTRVILLSDGVANVDVTDPQGILKRIQDNVDLGIPLTSIGVGMSNYNDVLLEQLADNGDGNYYYIDSPREAERVFVHNLAGTLQTIAMNVKIQVDFNPEVTDRYRLIGYENRDIADEDFRDDAVDAGEIGAGHNITALYELALEESELAPSDVVATVYVRYEDATTHAMIEESRPLTVGDLLPDIHQAPRSFRLHTAAAEFAELLRESYWAREGSYADLLEFASALELEYRFDQEALELVELIRIAGEY